MKNKQKLKADAWLKHKSSCETAIIIFNEDVKECEERRDEIIAYSDEEYRKRINELETKEITIQERAQQIEDNYLKKYDLVYKFWIKRLNVLYDLLSDKKISQITYDHRQRQIKRNFEKLSFGAKGVRDFLLEELYKDFT